MAGAVAPEPEPISSPLDEALRRVGDRWTLHVVAALLDGPARFGELADQIPGIAPNILSERLRRLEGDGLVATRPYSRRPPRYEYELTAPGRELAGALQLLTQWGARYAAESDAVLRHDCGTALEARWWCPSCQVAASEDEMRGGQLV